MRFFDFREILELAVGALAGLGAAILLLKEKPGLLPGSLSPDTWRLIGAGAGMLVAVIWSAWQVDRKIDRRIPAYQRNPPAIRDGRPFGVLAWRTKDAASEYLWLVMGAVIVVLVVWLARRFVV